jgi:hypothetical protein
VGKGTEKSKIISSVKNNNYTNDDRVECSICGRKFNEDRIEKHE